MCQITYVGKIHTFIRQQELHLVNWKLDIGNIGFRYALALLSNKYIKETDKYNPVYK